MPGTADGLGKPTVSNHGRAPRSAPARHPPTSPAGLEEAYPDQPPRPATRQHSPAATSAAAAGVVDIAFGLDYGDASIPRSRDVALVGLRSERFRIAIASSRKAKHQTVSLADLADEGWGLPPAATQYGLAIRMACRRVGFEPAR
ncbi:LysR substrate-binding domain-containing protein [Micromonospora sp. DT47]|uniref:LysR substrate-binding domain-containing protein n=1 Tax=Micromonospora sp. DT47 TaxID=3393431 RepID=UPI003CF7C7FC